MNLPSQNNTGSTNKLRKEIRRLTQILAILEHNMKKNKESMLKNYLNKKKT